MQLHFDEIATKVAPGAHAICPARSSWMAWRPRTDNPTKQFAIAAAAALTGTQQSREHLAIYASKLAVQPNL
jgi:hypothetical protein